MGRFVKDLCLVRLIFDGARGLMGGCEVPLLLFAEERGKGLQITCGGL